MRRTTWIIPFHYCQDQPRVLWISGAHRVSTKTSKQARALVMRALCERYGAMPETITLDRATRFQPSLYL